MYYRNVVRVGAALCLVLSAEAGAQFPTTNGSGAENGSSFKNDASVAIAGCRNTATVMVYKAHPNADSVRFSLGPQVQVVSRYETDVRDIGAYMDKVRLEWALFAIDCTYNYQQSDARVSVTWSPGTGEELNTLKNQREREAKDEAKRDRSSKNGTRLAESGGTKTP